MKFRDPVTGRIRSKATGTKNKQAAQLLANQLQAELLSKRTGAYDPAEAHRDMLFEAARDSFLAEKVKRNRAKTAEAYRYSIRAFEKIAEPKKLWGVDRRMIDGFVNMRLDEVKPVTVNKDLRQIRALLEWCRNQNYIAVAPDFKGLFLSVDQAEPTLIPDKDVKAVMVALEDEALITHKRSREWWKVFIRTALFTGMRRSELLGLKWSEVDFEQCKVQVIRFTSKGRRDRSYENAVSLVAELRQWYDAQPIPPEMAHCVLPFEKDPRGLYKDWNTILEHAKIPTERRFTPHDCRSTCVSELLARGKAITSVRDWVGHSSVSVTERHYAATRNDRRDIAGEREIV